jgi:hypothetical protein
MKNINKILIIALVLLIGSFLYSHSKNNSLKPKPPADPTINPGPDSRQNPSPPQETTAPQKNFAYPIDRAKERIIKKPFGIFITPQNSPVQPERFSGYHTGTDFETFPEEQNIDIPIYAISKGKIIEKQWVSGYGGVLVESAMINNEPVTIIYGHLNLDSINKKTGDNLGVGKQIGVLGKGYSQQTDGERKHLHLGIHKGAGVNVKGYVQNKTQLNDWIDSSLILSF